MGNLITGLIIAGSIIFAFRLFGAWMLRINDVIEELQAIKKELRKDKSCKGSC